jgi:hypothetical protein
MSLNDHAATLGNEVAPGQMSTLEPGTRIRISVVHEVVESARDDRRGYQRMWLQQRRVDNVQEDQVSAV